MREWWIVALIIILKVLLLSWNSPFGPRAKMRGEHVAYILYPSQFRIRIFCSRFLFLWVPRNTRKSRKSGDSRLLIPSLLSRSVVGIDSQKKLFTFFFLWFVLLSCFADQMDPRHIIPLPLNCCSSMFSFWFFISEKSSPVKQVPGECSQIRKVPLIPATVTIWCKKKLGVHTVGEAWIRLSRRREEQPLASLLWPIL